MVINIEAAHIKSVLEDLTKQTAQSASSTPADLANKFQAMMDKSSFASPGDCTGRGMTIASKMLELQDAQFQHLVGDMQDFSQHAHTMSLGEVAANAIKLTAEMASVQLDMEGKLGVVNSSKSAIETLMKNQ